MARHRIVLSGVSPQLKGLSWETEKSLRIGRQGNMDIVLQDNTIARIQAIVRRTGRSWVVKDLANSYKNPCLRNGVKLNGQEVQLDLHDVLQFGRTELKVTALESEDESPKSAAGPDDATQSLRNLPRNIKTSHGLIRVAAATQRSWDESLQKVVADPVYADRQSEHLLTLLRTGHHLRHIASLTELLESILQDAIHALNAQRGAIVLADRHGALELRAMSAPNLPERVRGLGYSRTLAQQCFNQGESLLCQDTRTEAAIQDAASVRRGAMMSIACVVLRSPRRKLGVLHLDRGPFQDPFTKHDFCLADAIAASASVGIESALLVERQREEFIQSVTSLARTVEMRDQYTGDHTRRVTQYAAMLARELRLPAQDIGHIEIGTPLHDIGKIGVNDAVLRKKGKLTPEEFEHMKSHTVKGADILGMMESMSPLIPIVRHHHERWDGKGYPDELGSHDIPTIARVVAVADAFDAMTSDRPYRNALPVETAFAELRKNAGGHFDPECIAAFLAIRPLIEKRIQQSSG